MRFFSLYQKTEKSMAYEMGYNFTDFILDNVYLIVGLILGIIVAVVMRKNLKIKP